MQGLGLSLPWLCMEKREEDVVCVVVCEQRQQGHLSGLRCIIGLESRGLWEAGGGSIEGELSHRLGDLATAWPHCSLSLFSCTSRLCVSLGWPTVCSRALAMH
jgi:hypothetical protein